MVGVKVEHVLILVIVAFVIYKLSRSQCINRVNGFSAGGEKICIGKTCNQRRCQECDLTIPWGKHCGTNLKCSFLAGNNYKCPGKTGSYCIPD